MNRHNIADPGEKVLFIGNYDLATDEGTFEIMDETMNIGNWYTVEEVNDYFGSGIDHYLLVENGAYIPCDCFEINHKKFIEEKYNLR